MDNDDHDPWNEPSLRHPRAAHLMRDEILWNCAHEMAPFGSDEGWEAYHEYRRWRAENPEENLTACIAWILGDRLADYNESLQEVESLESSDGSAQSFGYGDSFTLDATIIATVLGQLVDEGQIDRAAKPYAYVAIARQVHPRILRMYDPSMADERRAILEMVKQVVDAA